MTTDVFGPLLTEKEVSALLRISVGTLRRRRLLGQPPVATKIGNALRYRPSDVQEFLDSCPTMGGTRDTGGLVRS